MATGLHVRRWGSRSPRRVGETHDIDPWHGQRCDHDEARVVAQQATTLYRNIS